MGENLLNLFIEVVILRVNRILLLCGFGYDCAVFHCEGTYRLSAGGVIGYVLGDDILCSRKCCGNIGNALFLVNIFCCDLLNRLLVFGSLLKEKVCKGLESALTCDRCTCLSMGTVGAVDIVDLGDRLCRG